MFGEGMRVKVIDEVWGLDLEEYMMMDRYWEWRSDM